MADTVSVHSLPSLTTSAGANNTSPSQLRLDAPEAPEPKDPQQDSLTSQSPSITEGKQAGRDCTGKVISPAQLPQGPRISASATRPSSVAGSRKSSLLHASDPYEHLSAIIASDARHSSAIFRRFDRLTTRNLLYFESELMELETRLQDLDNTQYPVGPMATYMHNWPIADIPVHKDASDITLRAAEVADKRRELVLTIRRTLKDYHEALKLASEIFLMKEPYHGDVQTLRYILNREEVKHISSEQSANASTGMNIVTANSGGTAQVDGSDSALDEDGIFEGPMNGRVDDLDDLCTLAKFDRNLITRFLEKRFANAFWDQQAFKFNKAAYSRISNSVKLICTMLVIVWLDVAIVALYFWRSDAGRLVLFTVALLWFTIILSFFSNARAFEIYTVVAT
ncbi:Hypothetical protein D9617_9g023660 [Elsinoe fawcettii]|nr:Hypothetical protein D9617_9g023660 [Elsinoe fawcettii]